MPRLTAETSNPFVDALFAKITDSYSQLMGGTPVLMSYANGLHSTFQGGPNAYWNPKALNDVDKIVVGTDTKGLLTLGNQSFSFLYSTALGAIAYVISDDDKQRIRTDQQNADASIATVINAWEASFGSIKPDQMTTAVPPSKIGYIQSQVVKTWNGDINQAPSSLNDLKIAYQTYQVQASTSYQILYRSNRAQQEIEAAKANTLKPTMANGGVQTGDSTYQIAYDVPTQAKINADLQAANHAITLSVKAESFSERTVNGTVEGHTGFSIPVLDLFSVDVEGSVNYDWSSKLSNSSTMTINMKWPGVTIIGIEPAIININSQGWYDELILQEALRNAGKGTKVTGFQLQGHEFDNFFGPGGSFRRVKSVLVSQVPTMSITFTQADVKALAKDFSEKANVKVNLFGFIPLGSVSQSYEVSDVHEESQAGTVTITFGPSPAQSAVGVFDYTAYLLAGVPIYPPSEEKALELSYSATTIESALGRVYQIFKTVARDVYCSSEMFRSHAIAAQWMGDCMAAYGLTVADILSTSQSTVQPRNAIIWP
jgi:hypothetical protein